jgi:hypothetical protein
VSIDSLSLPAIRGDIPYNATLSAFCELADVARSGGSSPFEGTQFIAQYHHSLGYVEEKAGQPNFPDFPDALEPKLLLSSSRKISYSMESANCDR